ncbi:hypothetical protein QUA62_28465 [Microcoleus sp. MON1_C1]|uniref:hypothetical protein n=1 Tax=Microcoleus sp. MON1_C1 TaxID=2818827 RepID=UPI002FD3130B
MTQQSECPNSEDLYVEIKDEVANQIIKHGLSKVESKLFFYFLKLDRSGNQPVEIKVAEVLLATGVSKARYYAAIAKFQRMGWFDFTRSTMICIYPEFSDGRINNNTSELEPRDTVNW